MNKKAWMIYYFNMFFDKTMYFMFVTTSGIVLCVLFIRNIYFRKKFIKINLHRFLITPLVSAIKFLAQAITIYGIAVFALVSFLYDNIKELIAFRRELIEEYCYQEEYELEGGTLVLG